MADDRIAWADIAKGLAIILVVYGHAVDGVHAAVPLPDWLYDSLMKPFGQVAVPLFFFVSGLFAAAAQRRAWPDFLDRTIANLVWIFLVWNILQYAGRMAFAAYANTPIDPAAILWFWVNPINVTWFLWALVVYYLILRVTRDWPQGILLAAAAVLAADPWLGDNFALQQSSRFFVFFLLGHALAPWVRGLRQPPGGIWLVAVLGLYLVANLTLVHSGRLFEPLPNFLVRCLGIAGVLGLCLWLEARGRLAWLRWLGTYTLSIFVMHTIVTAAAREVLLRGGITEQPVLLIGVATVAGIVVPLAVQLALQRLNLPWLFQRPAWFKLPAAGPTALTARP